MKKRQKTKRPKKAREDTKVPPAEPERVEPSEEDFGGMDLKNFRRNLGCGG